MSADDGQGHPQGPAPAGQAIGALIEPDWVLHNLDASGVVVLEISRDPASGETAVGCIPGASRVYWKDLLWDSNRRDFADSKELAGRLGRLGISVDTQIVVCGDPVQFGTYAYWVLKMLGHARVGIMDGGKAYWEKADLPLSSQQVARPVVEYPDPGADQTSRIGREELLASLGTDDIVVVDLRTDEEYLGQRVAPRTHVIDNGAQAYGRIPGAHHLFYQTLLAADGRFLSRPELAERFRGAGISFDKPVALYCRLGHRASLGWFCLSEVVGFGSARVYDGSWTEWGSMVGMPVER